MSDDEHPKESKVESSLLNEIAEDLNISFDQDEETICVDCSQIGKVSLTQSIINNLPGYVFWKDKDSVFMGCNERFARLGGETAKSIIGKTDFDLPWNPEESEMFVADDKEVMRSKEAKLNIEESIQVVDGSELLLLTQKMPLKDSSGNVIGVFGGFVLNQEKAKMEMTHGANNLFSLNMRNQLIPSAEKILALSKQMLKEEPNQERLEQIRAIFSAGGQLLNVLNSFLDPIRKLRILVVEDDQISQIVASARLSEQFFCEVEVASTGNEAIRLASEKTYDLILMDVGLPDRKGEEVTEILRTYCGYSHAPIIAVTVHSWQTISERCRNVMDDYIMKPLDRDKVKEMFRKWISRVSKLQFSRTLA